MNKNICCIILDYCGGQKTDLLYEKIFRWNRGFEILLLDNASPDNISKYVTHKNSTNSGIGGGIIDSLKIAQDLKANFLFFIANDIHPITKIDLHYTDMLLRHNRDIVQLSASITKNSDQAKYYPWMINEGNHDNRIVVHSDILCCAIKTEFINGFGGFPASKGGWGYDWELAYNAKQKEKKIVITDYFTIKHANNLEKKAAKVLAEKQYECEKIYNAKYGSYIGIFNDTLNL